MSAMTTTVLVRLKQLGVNSIVYSLSGVLTRAISLFLVPVYTRALTPQDYGILGVATTVLSLLGVLLMFSLQAAVTRFYPGYALQERRALLGTLLVFLTVVSGALALGLELAGSRGWLDSIAFAPFRPYLSLILWTAYLTIFLTLLQSVYIAQQRPVLVMLLNLANTLLVVGLSIYFVVILRQGAQGSLLAGLLAALAMGVVSFALLVRMSSVTFSTGVLRIALLFSLPLIPHLISHWLLNLSDRFVLLRYVDAAQLGIYTLAYQFGMLMNIFTTSVSTAIMPAFMLLLKSNAERDSVPRLGTYTICAVWWVALGLALLSGTVIRILTPPDVPPGQRARAVHRLGIRLSWGIYRG